MRGTGESGSIITLYNGTTVIGTTTVVNGLWNITPTTALPNGTYTLTAVATDAAGNPSGTSNSISFTVNSTPLVVSNIEDDQGVFTGSLSNGSVTDDTLPTISGTGIAGSTVYIYDNGLPDAIATVQVGVDGTWSINVPLSEGVNNLTFIAKTAMETISPLQRQ